jgi:NADH:ubiquinone oxidoreductase subunit 4 (subunit M)
MNATHIHLLFNHVPVLGSIFGLIILAFGLFGAKRVLRRTSYYIFIIVALFTLPVYFSGEGAEEVVEDIAGVSHTYIEEHEDLGNISLYLTLLTGVISVVALVAGAKSQKKGKLYAKILLVLGLISFTTIAITAGHGGKIRHSEIRGEAEHAH